MSNFVSRFRSVRSVREQHEHEQNEQRQQQESEASSWPPAPQDKKRGRATRIIQQTPEPFLQRNYEDDREHEKNEVAKRMGQDNTGVLARLQNRTQSVEEWVHYTGGKKKAEGQFVPHSDNGGSVIVHDPLIIKAKIRRGHQNSETTGMIAKEIELREEKRERDIAALENARSFHSLFSEQPKNSKGTAHVKPVWLMASQHQHHPTSFGENNNNNNATTMNQNSHHTSSSVFSDPIYQKSSPAGLPGLGEVDQFRQKQRGKQQYRGAKVLSSLVGGENNISNNGSEQRNYYNSNQNNNSFVPEYLPGIHKKASDGSRGLRINQQASHAVDSVKLAFESNPSPVRGKTQFSTTSSSIGNPAVAGELKEFVHGSTRQGPNTRHFSDQQQQQQQQLPPLPIIRGNNYPSSQFPPVGGQGLSAVYGGGGTSSMFRSRTPFPMSSNAMIGKF
jgi:hypothetical protein